MAQHTPGPWHLEYDAEDGKHIISLAADNEVQHRLEYDHGLYDDEEEDGPAQQFIEAEANARLIASAPDLLAALESIAEDCDRYGRWAEGAWSSAAIALQSCAQDARAVIRKARGE